MVKVFKEYTNSKIPFNRTSIFEAFSVGNVKQSPFIMDLFFKE